MPKWVWGILSALRVRAADFEALKILKDPEWEEALSFCDRAGLTLPLGEAARGRLPGWVNERIARNLAGNSERHERAKKTFAEIRDSLAEDGLEFLALKGFTQWPAFIPDPALRTQYDIDIYCEGPTVFRARDILAACGYEPLASFENFPTDHLPVMVRKTGWEWRGDFYDPEIPFAVELHFRFWDESTERLAVPGLDDFWTRRVERTLFGGPVAVLHPADALGYAALHMLRHLLRGNLRAYHVYELAAFLEARYDDEEFWAAWRTLHGDKLRRLESVAFRLAAEWFGCRLRAEARLPQGPVSEWFDRFAASPLEAMFRPNKDELWLHLSLLENAADRRSILRRRLLPLRMPGPVDAVFVPRSKLTWRRRVKSGLKYTAYLVERFRFHLRVLPRLALDGMTLVLEPAYWRFLAAASLFNLGMFIFVLLYNLLLLDRGFGERTIGLIAALATAGSVAGTLPAAALAHRFGLQKTLPACFVLAACLSAVRASSAGELTLALSAAASGSVMAIWAVSVAPAISQLTSERRRPLGFSFFCAFSIALGAVGGWLAGRLPGWLGGKQQALIAGCALMLAAVLPAARLPLGAAPASSRVFPRNRFIVRFLVALAAWNFAVGAFNPFFNAYFARRFQMPAEKIGLLFSAVQLLQAAPLLLAPWLLRRLGLVTGIASTLAATGVALAALAVSSSASAASLAYAAFMISQVISEPGLYTLLMGGVAPAERSGAAALHFLVGFGVQAAAAYAAGGGFSRFGYPPVLLAAAAAACFAAILFRMLLPRSVAEPDAGNVPK